MKLSSLLLSVATLFLLSGCGQDNNTPQPGTTAPQATIQNSNRPPIGLADEEYQKAKDEALAASDREYEARARGELPPLSQFKLPNTFDPEQPIPDYLNFYGINDHYPTYLLCEYRVNKREYNQSDETRWFNAALVQVRESGSTNFPPLKWIAIIIINRAEWNGVGTFERAHKIGAIFNASDVFNPSCNLWQLAVQTKKDQHPFKYDTSQPTPGEQQRWTIVERHALTNQSQVAIPK
jgi:hypothetical protein